MEKSPYSKRFWIVAALLCCISLCAPMMSHAAPTAKRADRKLSKTQEIAAAKSFTQLFLKSDLDAMRGRMDYDMINGLTKEQVQHINSVIKTKCGPLRKMGSPDFSTDHQYDIVYTPCFFAKASLNSKVVFNSQGKVAGFFWVSYPRL